MPTVHVFASTGRFSSFEDMRGFIEPKYSEDGDLIPSPFIDEVELRDCEPACIEAIHTSTPKPLPVLLEGVSYGDQWLHLVDPSVVANEAICVFEPNKLSRTTNSSLRYCGAYTYRVE